MEKQRSRAGRQAPTAQETAPSSRPCFKWPASSPILWPVSSTHLECTKELLETHTPACRQRRPKEEKGGAHRPMCSQDSPFPTEAAVRHHKCKPHPASQTLQQGQEKCSTPHTKPSRTAISLYTLNQQRKRELNFKQCFFFPSLVRDRSSKMFVILGNMTIWYQLGYGKDSPSSTHKNTLDRIQLILILTIFQNSPPVFNIFGKEPLGQLSESI